ncbi:hypothetical protein [Moorena sp. SIO3I6]|nr:hypothetical protein [Moorena sp. SIO3I6]NEP25925.1 hypothetical protein [Moorena sp. SIO3I6]
MRKAHLKTLKIIPLLSNAPDSRLPTPDSRLPTTATKSNQLLPTLSGT